MPAKSQRTRISDLISRGVLTIGDGYRAKNDELIEAGAGPGLPFARVGNIDNGFHFDDADLFPLTSLEKVGEKISRPGDVVFTSKGSVGRIVFVRSDTARFVYAPQLCYWRSLDHNVVDPRFLYCWMSGREFFLQYNGVKGQTDMADYVSLTDQRRMFITLPAIAVQRQVASVLGSLDDRIDLNRRANQTLEEIARAVFKEWFLDFGPVRAKLAGRAPAGLSGDLAALFPSRLTDSEIGPVPEGWTVECFEHHISAERGLSYKGSGLTDDPTATPMHNLNSIYEGGGYKHHGIKYYAGDYKEKHLVKPGDMIVSNTEQGFEHRLVGHAAIIPPRAGVTGIFSHHLYRVRVKPTSPLTPHYLVELFNGSRWHGWISGFANGTTINMLPKDALELPRMVIPPAALVQAFTRLAADTAAKIEANLAESETLLELREALLPQLISGELRLSTTVERVKIPEATASAPATATKKASDEFTEAVLIAQVVRKFASPGFVVGRMRYNKLAYLAHRKAEEDVSKHYLKKAAGPYSPWSKYAGPEKIAIKNGYIKPATIGKMQGFVPGDKAGDVDKYAPRYPSCTAVDWVAATFRYRKKEELELLATVDFAALDLIAASIPVNRQTVTTVIQNNPEWAPKLDRAIFSDENIHRALAELTRLFPATLGGGGPA